MSTDLAPFFVTPDGIAWCRTCQGRAELTPLDALTCQNYGSDHFRVNDGPAVVDAAPYEAPARVAP